MLIKRLNQVITRWPNTWKDNGWITTAGKPVKNPEIIKYILAMIRARKLQGQKFHMKKVKAHSGNQQNEAADALAKAGRFLPEIPDKDWESLIREQDRISVEYSSRYVV